MWNLGNTALRSSREEKVFQSFQVHDFEEVTLLQSADGRISAQAGSRPAPVAKGPL